MTRHCWVVADCDLATTKISEARLRPVFYLHPMQSLLTSALDGVLTVTINRPDKFNALNASVFNGLDEAMDNLIGNGSLFAAIITGEGSKAFAAGADIAELQGLSTEEGRALSIRGQRIFEKIENSPKPVIAAINGLALGGGCELAMCCHLRVAADNAQFGQPEVNLGLIPGYAGTQRLTRYIGKARSTEFLLTGDRINAEQALLFGLVNYVVPADELMTKSHAVLTKIKSKSPLNIRQLLNLVNAYYDKTANGSDIEAREFGNCFKTGDTKEGIAAFLEKRPAAFKGV